ncbi:hypothetical protein B0H21DRAFT_820218 [Amylocystis lapponica]|nr:hypothetical protein B0H21DRAFT_820218 [Amylocystis lapponica]
MNQTASNSQNRGTIDAGLMPELSKYDSLQYTPALVISRQAKQSDWRTRSLTRTEVAPSATPSSHPHTPRRTSTTSPRPSCPSCPPNKSPEGERDPFDAYITPYYTTTGVRARSARGSRERRARRKSAAHGWHKRVGDFECYVHHLQDEVDCSCEESAERSVMDETSGDSEALRMLHRRMEALEQERADTERRKQQAREEQLKKAREEVKRRDESEHVLKAGIKAAKEEMEEMSGIGQAKTSEDAARALAGWEEERAEVFPARYRAHDIPAASGKFGAIVAKLVIQRLLVFDISGRNTSLDHMYACVLHPAPCALTPRTRNLQVLAMAMLMGALATLLIPKWDQYTHDVLAHSVCAMDVPRARKSSAEGDTFHLEPIRLVPLDDSESEAQARHWMRGGAIECGIESAGRAVPVGAVLERAR